jgi:hypothetical protein
MYKSIIIVLLLLTVGCGQKDGYSLLGKDIQSNEIQSYLSSFSEKPTISEFDSGEHVFHDLEKNGISLSFIKGTLVHIFYYNFAIDGYSQYKGELPFQLSFDLTRREVESRIGKPDNTVEGVEDKWFGGAMSVRTRVCYSSKRIGVTYKTTTSEDLNAKIAIVTLNNEDCKKKSS